MRLSEIEHGNGRRSIQEQHILPSRMGIGAQESQWSLPHDLDGLMPSRRVWFFEIENTQCSFIVHESEARSVRREATRVHNEFRNVQHLHRFRSVELPDLELLLPVE